MQSQPSQSDSTRAASMLDAEMRAAVAASAAELFTHYKMPLQRSEAPADCHKAGILDFTGEGFRGRLTLATNEEVLRKSCPVIASDEEQLSDWAGELANQLLGRVKNKLLLKGVCIKLATPIGVSADDLPRAQHSNEDARPIRFSTPSGPLAIWITAEWAQRSVPERQCNGEPMKEGDLSLF